MVISNLVKTPHDHLPPCFATFRQEVAHSNTVAFANTHHNLKVTHFHWDKTTPRVTKTLEVRQNMPEPEAASRTAELSWSRSVSIIWRYGSSCGECLHVLHKHVSYEVTCFHICEMWQHRTKDGQACAHDGQHETPPHVTIARVIHPGTGSAVKFYELWPQSQRVDQQTRHHYQHWNDKKHMLIGITIENLGFVSSCSAEWYELKCN